MRTFLLLLVSGALLAQAPAAEPIASKAELMEAMVIPASNALFNAGLDEEVDDAGWAELRSQALILSEAANLLMMPGRAVDNSEWMAASRMLLEAGKAALKAVEAQDVDLLTIDVGDQILSACSTCHEKYMNQ